MNHRCCKILLFLPFSSYQCYGQYLSSTFLFFSVASGCTSSISLSVIWKVLLPSLKMREGVPSLRSPRGNERKSSLPPLVSSRKKSSLPPLLSSRKKPCVSLPPLARYSPCGSRRSASRSAPEVGPARTGPCQELTASSPDRSAPCPPSPGNAPAPPAAYQPDEDKVGTEVNATVTSHGRF